MYPVDPLTGKPSLGIPILRCLYIYIRPLLSYVISILKFLMSNVLLLFNKRSKVLLRLWHGLDDPTYVRSLGVVVWPYLHLSISTALIRPRRPKQYCLQLVIYIYIYIYIYSQRLYIYIYIYIYCGKKKTNKIQIQPYKPVSWFSYYVVQGNNKSPDERATTYHVYMYLLIGSYSRLLESLRHRWRHHQLHFASN